MAQWLPPTDIRAGGVGQASVQRYDINATATDAWYASVAAITFTVNAPAVTNLLVFLPAYANIRLAVHAVDAKGQSGMASVTNFQTLESGESGGGQPHPPPIPLAPSSP